MAYLASGKGKTITKNALDKQGRFLPYWYRGNTEQDKDKLYVDNLLDMETSLYYQGNKEQFLKHKKSMPMITEPYIYEGKMIMEHTYPIVINGQFKGVACVDRSLNAILAFIEQIKVLIEDTGVGISSNDYEKLFSPFTRLAYAEEHEIQGVGTGLSLSKYLIELMNGTIDFTSQPDIGSAFFVCLPIGQKVENTIEPVPAHKEINTDISVHKVIYIEDNQPSRKLMEEIAFDYPNIDLMAVSNVQAAIEATNTFEPRLIMIDINMPVTTGLGAVKLLRKMFDKQDIKYVAVSADAMKDQINHALKIGFDDYITKPINFDQIESLFNGLGGLSVHSINQLTT
jgi:CheY-like chemotaxis protein